ncbi:MAG TPA: DUF6049 family protein [Actinomycetota bacterium]|nr:DUF6049 family protein [Actinomycetota bacterium]
MPTPRSRTVTLARALAAATAAALLALAAAPPAVGQEGDPLAALVLRRQTPWVTVEEPRLGVEVRATNLGRDPLEDLSLGIALWGPVRSRSAYLTSLSSDPLGVLPLLAQTRPQEGALAPGASRTFAFRLDLSFLASLSSQSLVYPLRVELRSRGTPVAVLRTPVIHLVPEPEVPLSVAWWWELHEPIRYGPDGRFSSGDLEEAVGPGGWLTAAVDALRLLALGRRTTPVDLVVSPTLLMQLQRMRAGYEVVEGGELRTVDEGEGGAARAAALLQELRAIAGSRDVELLAYPFSAPLLPAMVGGGLARDLPAQFARGRAVAEALLGAEPSSSVFRPPAGALDQPALEFLAREGVRVVLAEPGSAPRPRDPLGFAPPAIEPLDAAPWGAISAVLPDPGLQTRISPATLAADPVLGAQRALGELAAIWLEQPAVPRAVALSLPAGLPPGFARPLAYRIARAPFLRPRMAGELAVLHPPSEESVRLRPTGAVGFSRTYVEQLKRARRLVEDYRSMLVEESPLPAALATRLLVAEGGQFVGDEAAGLAFVDAVRSRVEEEFAKIRPETAPLFTLTTRSGTIPIRLTNATGRPVRVVVALVSSRIRLTGAQAREVELARPEQTLEFRVELRTTGLFPVRVVVRTPSGRHVGEATFSVRSTAYNRIALILTLGAALVLVALWGRRFVPRRSA